MAVSIDRDHIHTDVTVNCSRCPPPDGIAKCNAISVLAADSGAAQGVKIDSKHQIITNKALTGLLSSCMFIYFAAGSYPSGQLRNKIRLI